MPRPVVTVPVCGMITPSTTTYLKRRLSVLDGIPRVYVEIDSTGGSSKAGRDIFHFLLTQHVITLGRDLVESAAVLVLLGGRFRLMKHDASIYLHRAQFTADDTDRREERLEEADRLYAEIVARRTGVFTKEEVLKAMRDETSLNAEKAVLYGFAHTIIPKETTD